jgi:hypothetical protein
MHHVRLGLAAAADTEPPAVTRTASLHVEQLTIFYSCTAVRAHSTNTLPVKIPPNHDPRACAGPIARIPVLVEERRQHPQDTTTRPLAHTPQWPRALV